jgi:hypothetical protein
MSPILPIRPLSARERRRADAVDRLLSALEQLVSRHRALSVDDLHGHLHAELVAAEVAHELAITRSDLLRHPALRPKP